MPTIPPLLLSDAERAELERRVRAHTTAQRAVKRARVVLLAADGVPNRQIAPLVGMDPIPSRSGGGASRSSGWRGSRTASGRAGHWSTTTTIGCGSWPR